MSKLKKALERAKEERTSMPGASALKDTNVSLQVERVPEKSKATPAGRHSNLAVSYSQTKVEQIDPQILMNNKLISYSQDNEISEQVKTLRVQLLNRLKEIGGNSLLVTSANAGEGKTFTSINLGISISQELGHTVLIVDADLKTPLKDHKNFTRDFFGLNTQSGLSDYLQGKIEIPELLLNPGINKMTILPGGKVVQNSAELLGSQRMKDLMSEMKSRYKGDRVVIVDSPSISRCADAVILAEHVDGVLLVVEEEKTTPEDLKRVIELLSDRPILGSILNKSRP